MSDKITSTITHGNKDPGLSCTGWPHWDQDDSRYTVTLRYQKRQFTFPFWTSTTRGWTSERQRIIFPEPRHWTDGTETFDAAYCILSEAAAIEACSDFKDWCHKYGGDAESLYTKEHYLHWRKTARSVRRLLGDDFDELVTLDKDELKSRCR